MTRWAALALLALASCTVAPDAGPPELAPPMPPTMTPHTLRSTTTSAGLVPLPAYDPDEDR